VRELRNCLERAIILADDGMIGERNLRLGPEPVFLESVRDETLADARERAAQAAERIWLVRSLEKHRGDRSAAAEEAGLTPRRFEAKLKEHGLGDA
jgi:DNA-binding NtrC family response regulator